MKMEIHPNEPLRLGEFVTHTDSTGKMRVAFVTRLEGTKLTISVHIGCPRIKDYTWTHYGYGQGGGRPETLSRLSEGIEGDNLWDRTHGEG